MPWKRKQTDRLALLNSAPFNLTSCATCESSLAFVSSSQHREIPPTRNEVPCFHCKNNNNSCILLSTVTITSQKVCTQICGYPLQLFVTCTTGQFLYWAWGLRVVWYTGKLYLYLLLQKLQKLIPVSLIPRLPPAQQCKVKVKSVKSGN